MGAKPLTPKKRPRSCRGACPRRLLTGASDPIWKRPWSSRSSRARARTRVIGADFRPPPRYIGSSKPYRGGDGRAEL